MSNRKQITFAELAQLGKLSAVELFQATLCPVEGAGYRIFLHRNGVDYQVVGEGDQTYFPSFEQLIQRLLDSGVVCHRMIVDAVSMVSVSKFHNHSWGRCADLRTFQAAAAPIEAYA